MTAAFGHALIFLLLTSASMASADGILLDDFEDLSGWSAITSEGAQLKIAQEAGYSGMGLRVDFDFTAGGGFVLIRKAFPIKLPENYTFNLYVRAEAPKNNVEFKLIDPSGQNVWWRQRRHYEFSKEWKPIVVKKRYITFAWGPAGGGEIKEVGAIELAISADAGGKGSVWIDDLRLEEREPVPYTLKPEVRASTSIAGHEPERVLDPDPQSYWESQTPREDQWLMIDFLKNREYGGLVIDWDREDYAAAYEVQTSEDGVMWKTAYAVSAGNGGRDYIYMPDAESRYLKLELRQSSRGKGYRLHGIVVKPDEFSTSPNRFFEAIARDSERGAYPKYLYGEQSYWTLVGWNGDFHEGLINEEGMLEVAKGAFSIEPFLYTNGRLITWASVEPAQELEDGYLPIPSVVWRDGPLTLRITAFAAEEEPGRSALYVRYRLENTGTEPQRASLFLAMRPFQVNPSWQNLTMDGGVTHIKELLYDGNTVWVNGEKALIPLTAPERFGAVTFDQGSVADFLKEDRLPAQQQVSDSFGYASGALGYGLDLTPGEAREVYLTIPFYKPQAVQATTHEQARALWDFRFEETKRYWRTKLARVEIQLPPDAQRIVETLKSTLAYILINRDGPAIQPGSRSYHRSWIRDGALTSTALLEMGYVEEVRDFIKWFSNYQFANGKVPCCVDHRGPDSVPEHDSHGEFIFLLMEYYRHTRDVGLLVQMWPQVVKAVEYIGSLRQQRLTEEYQSPGKRAFYGLVPESISHEGYSSHPVHSYWDDFWILRGLKDAASMAAVVGDEDRMMSYAALRDAFRADLFASIAATMDKHRINYLPASVELGDFDPSSTAIAVNPNSELPYLPQAALTRTYEDYYTYFQRRRKGKIEWNTYTPYELRIVGTYVRMGQAHRALEGLQFFMDDQRPKAWNQWAEIVWRDPKAPRFIGDMPHTWVGSEFIRSVRAMLLYEDEANQSLVIAAGVPWAWVESATGVAVKRLPTHYGTLNYSLKRTGAGEVRIRLSGDVAMPAGKILVKSPLPRLLKEVTVNGRAIQTFDAKSATVGEFPAEVVLRY